LCDSELQPTVVNVIKLKLMTTAGCSTLSHMQLCKLCWCRV